MSDMAIRLLNIANLKPFFKFAIAIALIVYDCVIVGVQWLI